MAKTTLVKTVLGKESLYMLLVLHVRIVVNHVLVRMWKEWLKMKFTL